MNTTYRFLTGTLSSLLLAMGFERLAAHLDPLSRNQAANASISGVVADSSVTCWAELPEN
jgi:hypothetical protein